MDSALSSCLALGHYRLYLLLNGKAVWWGTFAMEEKMGQGGRRQRKRRSKQDSVSKFTAIQFLAPKILGHGHCTWPIGSRRLRHRKRRVEGLWRRGSLLFLSNHHPFSSVATCHWTENRYQHHEVIIILILTPSLLPPLWGRVPRLFGRGSMTYLVGLQTKRRQRAKGKYRKTTRDCELTLTVIVRAMAMSLGQRTTHYRYLNPRTTDPRRSWSECPTFLTSNPPSPFLTACERAHAVSSCPFWCPGGLGPAESQPYHPAWV